MKNNLLPLNETIDRHAPEVSFEFFPPKSDDAINSLKNTILSLEKFSPRFVSVTYGAGGSTKENTFKIIKWIKENTSVNPAAHLTCVGASKDEINEVAKSYLNIGVNRIVALRGDMPGFKGKYEPRADGYAYASDLVAGLMKLGDFDISVAAYPETHPEAISPEKDIEHLKRKIDAGAARAITQMCFDTETLLRFIDKARKNGIKAPIIPGVVTIAGFAQLVNFAKNCGASVPKWLHTLFEQADENPALRDNLATIVASEQCRILMQEGIKEFHFYTLNRAPVTENVCHLLGIRRK